MLTCQPQTLHNSLTDGRKTKREKDLPYREFGVHFSLTTVTEKPMRWNSRSLRHLAQTSTNSDVGPPQTEDSCPPPARHAPRRRWANQRRAGRVEGGSVAVLWTRSRASGRQETSRVCLVVGLWDAQTRGKPQHRNVSVGKVREKQRSGSMMFRCKHGVLGSLLWKVCTCLVSTIYSFATGKISLLAFYSLKMSS